MPAPTLADRIRGSVLGVAIGDALGAPFEFRPVAALCAETGRDWLDRLYPSTGGIHQHGLWRERAPAGTGTDDTRYLYLFLRLAAELGRLPDARAWAELCLDIYAHPGALFPGHEALCAAQFHDWEPACRGYLGQPSAVFPGVAPDVLRTIAFGNLPVLLGLIVLPCAGACYPGQPERAYLAAYEADFADLAYAREAVAFLAAALSLALAEPEPPLDLIARAAAVDPLHTRRAMDYPMVIRDNLPAFCRRYAASASDRAAAASLSADLAPLPPMEAFKTLAIACSALVAAPADPVRALAIAANHTTLGEDPAFQDIDCYAAITGALAGALHGVQAWPPDLVATVLDANRDVYGIDLEAAIDAFVQRFGGD